MPHLISTSFAIIRYSDETVGASAALLEGNPDLYLAWNYRKCAFLHRWLKAGRIPAGNHTTAGAQASAANPRRSPAAVTVVVSVLADDGGASGSAPPGSISSASDASITAATSNEGDGASHSEWTGSGSGSGTGSGMPEGNGSPCSGRESLRAPGAAVEGGREGRAGERRAAGRGEGKEERASSRSSDTPEKGGSNRESAQVTTEEGKEDRGAEENVAGEAESRQARLVLEEAELRVVRGMWCACKRMCV